MEGQDNQCNMNSIPLEKIVVQCPAKTPGCKACLQAHLICRIMKLHGAPMESLHLLASQTRWHQVARSAVTPSFPRRPQRALLRNQMGRRDDGAQSRLLTSCFHTWDQAPTLAVLPRSGNEHILLV